MNGIRKADLKTYPISGAVEAPYEWELKSAVYLMETLGYADIAHVAMLIKMGIINKENAKRLLLGLIDFQKRGIWRDKTSPAMGDVYTNRRHLLKKYIGDKITDYIEAGRPRREATNIAFLITCRELIVDIGLNLCLLCSEMLRLVDRYKRLYMTDFTYLQHAHPTTLGHYLLSYVYPFIRDIGRFKDAYKQVNQSPAGSGSTNGSILPLDRKYIANLLGFDGIITHTRDAMWRHDIAIEAFYPVITALTTLGRLCDDLLIWNTAEFGFIEFSASHCRKSVIMPQKKNPYALTFIRGLARYITGELVGIITTGHTPSGQPDNRIFIYHDLPDNLLNTKKAIELFREVITNARFNIKRLKDSCTENFTIATDIADYLVVNYGLDSRSAYNVVQNAVQKANATGQSNLTPELIHESAGELSINIPDKFREVFNKVFDVKRLIQLRKGIGGAGEDSIREMLSECRREITGYREFFKKRTADRFRKRFYRRIEGIIRRL